MVLIRINENGEKINSWNSFAILSSSLCLESVKRWGLREFWWESFTSPSVKCWPGLSSELHVTVLCTGFRVYRSCLCEEQGFIPVTILVNICYPWLPHACRELCFIAVGSANSQIESLHSTGRAAECCAGAASGVLQCAKDSLVALPCLTPQKNRSLVTSEIILSSLPGKCFCFQNVFI